MKQITGTLIFATAVLSVGLLVSSASMASTTSPRHGQQTVDVSGGPAAKAAPQSGNQHQMPDMSMMNSDGMANTGQCSKMMRERDGAGAPGHMAMGHRSDMHAQMHANMSECMANMHSGGMGMGN
jgi:hypothetical protein